MTLKAIHMAPERHARLKAMAKERGFTSTAKFVEKLVVEADSKADAGLEPYRPESIDAEVEKRLRAKLSTLPSSLSSVPPVPPVSVVGDWSGTREISQISGHTIEDCARTLLNMLPESTKAFAYEVCDHLLHIQPSQLIHGHLMNAADGGTLQAPHIDASWEVRKEQMDRKQSICEWHECQQPFTPERWSQRFCSNICGGKHATSELPKPAIKTQPILDAPGMQSLIAV